MTDLITVVVPVYKTEAFLPRCLESLLSQSYKSLQIILVDDGSPDQCPQICDAYAKLDSRIQVIHKKNGGASSARNAGLDAAKGKYLCFVDSDDTVPVGGIEALFCSIQRGNSQYAAGVCGIEGTKTVKNEILQATEIDFNKEPEEVLRYITRSGSYSPYAKIFVTDIIKNNHLYYDTELKCSEDALFIREYLRYCTRLSLCPDTVYWYNTANETSLSKKGYINFSKYYVKKMQALEKFLNHLPITVNRREQFLCERGIHGIQISLRHYFYNFDRDSECQKALMKQALEDLDPWIYDGTLKDKKLYYWYQKNRLNIKERNINEFISEFTAEKRSLKKQLYVLLRRMKKRLNIYRRTR